MVSFSNLQNWNIKSKNFQKLVDTFKQKKTKIHFFLDVFQKIKKLEKENEELLDVCFLAKHKKQMIFFLFRNQKFYKENKKMKKDLTKKSDNIKKLQKENEQKSEIPQVGTSCEISFFFFCLRQVEQSSSENFFFCTFEIFRTLTNDWN